MIPIPTLSQIRDTVQVRFPDGRAFDAPIGTSLEAFIDAAQPQVNGRVVAAWWQTERLALFTDKAGKALRNPCPHQ